MKSYLDCPVVLVADVVSCKLYMQNISSNNITEITVFKEGEGDFIIQIPIAAKERVAAQNAGVTQSAVIKRVLFEDGSAWQAEGLLIEYAYDLPSLDEVEALTNRAGADAVCFSAGAAEAWTCVCGTPNPNATENCRFCGRLRDIILQNLSRAALMKTNVPQNVSPQLNLQAVPNANGVRAAADPKKTKQMILFGSIALGVVALVLVFLLAILPAIQYGNAERMLENGEYDQAIQAFASLSNYADSPEKIVEAKLEKADKLLASGNFDAAKSVYLELQSIMDVSQILLECDYLKGSAMLKSNQYDEAIAAFQNIGNYKDSAELILEAKYKKADSLAKAGSFQEAITLFDSLKTYKDSEDRLSDCVVSQVEVLINTRPFLPAHQAAIHTLYNQYSLKPIVTQTIQQLVFNGIKKLINENKIDEAYGLLSDFSSYNGPGDSSYNELYYMLGVKYQDTKAYDKAIEMFKYVGNYKDAQKHLNECNYQTAIIKTKSESRQAAMIFYNLSKINYKDSKKRLNKIYTTARCRTECDFYNISVKYAYYDWGYYYYKVTYKMKNNSPFTLQGGIDFVIYDEYGSKYVSYQYITDGIDPGEVISGTFYASTYGSAKTSSREFYNPTSGGQGLKIKF
jgi:tetratricopeptide (TPR) repeat protein